MASGFFILGRIIAKKIIKIPWIFANTFRVKSDIVPDFRRFSQNLVL